MSATKFSITAQRVVSLLTGEVRKNPINPVRRPAGMVQIGNMRAVPVTHTVEEFEREDRALLDEWNAAKQSKRAHECGAALMGMACGHAS